ncbi:hypothetical protein GCM10009715_36110 [Paeniglutamicibacter psychrophenolicus]
MAQQRQAECGGGFRVGVARARPEKMANWNNLCHLVSLFSLQSLDISKPAYAGRPPARAHVKPRANETKYPRSPIAQAAGNTPRLTNL